VNIRRSIVAACIVGLANALSPSGSGDDGGGPKQKPAPAKVKDEGLRRELLERTAEEQKLRMKWIKLEAKTGADPQSIKKEIDLTLTKLTEIDARNRARMKEIVDRYGWPGKSLVGGDGSNAAWLLVQHADPDHPFQKRCVGLLADAVKLLPSTSRTLRTECVSLRTRSRFTALSFMRWTARCCRFPLTTSRTWTSGARKSACPRSPNIEKPSKPPTNPKREPIFTSRGRTALLSRPGRF
jgi:hypothetical protein